MYNVFLVYFLNIHMYRTYLGPSSGGCTGWIGSNQTRTTDSHLKTIISTNCCIHTVVPLDDGPRYARNMQSLTKYTKNKLCIKLTFLYTIISRRTVKKTKQKIQCVKKLQTLSMLLDSVYELQRVKFTTTTMQ